MSDSVVNEVTSGLTRVDHEALSELHRLGTSSTELAGNDNLTTLGARLHDESEDTVTGSDNVSSAGHSIDEQLVQNTHRRIARPPRSLYLRDSA